MSRPFGDLQHPPELALCDENGAGMHPADDKRLVERPDRPARDHVVYRDFPLVVDHGEVEGEVPAGPGGRHDPAPVDPDEAVLLHLFADFVEKRAAGRKDRRPFEDRPDLLPLDLPVFDRDRRDLVGHHICGIGVRHDPLDLVCLCLLCDNERFEQVVKTGGKDRPLRDRIELVARTADTLDEPCDLAGRPELDDMVDPADIDTQFHRRGADQGSYLAFLEPVLGIDPDLFRERPVVHLDVPALEEGVPERLRGDPGIDEDERGAFGLRAYSDRISVW